MKKTTNVKVAAGNSVPMNLSRNHYTTLGFGSLFPAYNLECVPGDKITITPSLFARVAPMVLPPFANVDVKLTAFFVPFRNVWRHWNNFLGGLPVTIGSDMYNFKSVPVISRSSLIDLFNISSSYFTSDPRDTSAVGGESRPTYLAYWAAVEQRPSSSYTRATYSLSDISDALTGARAIRAWDPYTESQVDFPFDFTLGNGPYNALTFSKQGKRVLQILHSLGYNFNFHSIDGDDEEYFSALPLLCFFKAFVDWHVPSQLQNSSPIHRLLNSIGNFTPNSSGIITIDSSDILSMFLSVVDYYDNDYFTSAWLYSNSPADGLNKYGGTAFEKDGYVTTNNVSQNIKSESLRDSNPEVVTDNWDVRAPTPASLSYDGLTLLERFANFIRRNNFAGSRAVERILARFGVRVPDAVVDYSDYIGSWTTPLQITDVTSQGSNLDNLGDYAGKGFVSSQNSPTWTYEVQQHGMLFVFAAVDTNTTFLDGVRRELYHLSPLDYYTPEFDGTLMQAIAGSELQGKNLFGISSNVDVFKKMKLTYKDVYGFIQRYAEYKRSLDDISGDFDLNRFRTSLSSFIFTRNLLVQSYKTYGLDWTPSAALLRTDGGSTDSEYTPIDALSYADASQYNHIFKDTTGMADPFFCQFRFDVTAHRRMLAANDTAELFGRGGSNEMNTNGARV